MLRLKQALILAGLMAFLPSAHALDSRDDLNLGVGGSFACNGGQTSSTDFTVWGFRNFNEASTIIINRFRVYDAEGVLIYDTSVSGFPVGFKSTLLAHQSTPLNSTTFLGTGSYANPLQLHMDWSSVEGARVLSPNVAFLRGSNSGGCRMTAFRSK